MNFKRVEIYGFKSFADKAEIEFGNGITGIVGPNGCGKSNVADAIRWVLGEQSPKNLRGGTMQDVIFSGTQNRKSLSYCEVSLVFDNSDHIFSLDYNEIVITRKLFRDGKSEYYINKQEARLKDIVNLLHECRIGKEGYTIIGQGRVEEIMSAKPEDRRLIFEEATGIARFKSEKNENERKLARTHENIVRYADIMTEIENQLAPLEKQAEKTKLYNELSADLKYHELNTYVNKVEGVANEKAKINNKIKGLDEEIALRKEELVKTQQQHDKIFNDISTYDRTLKDLNEEMLQKRLSMEQNSGAKKLFEQKISYLQSQIERANHEIEINNELIKESEISLEENKKIINNSRLELSALEKKVESYNKTLFKLNERIALGEELASMSHKRLIESMESISNNKQSRGAISATQLNLKEKIEELKNKQKLLAENRDKLIFEKDSYDKSINGLDKAVFDVKNKINAKEEEVKKGNEDTAKVDNEIYSLNSLITSLDTKSKFYLDMKENYEGFSSGVKLLFNDAKKNIELKKRLLGVVAKLITSDKKYDIALETALASATQNVVTENTDDTKYLINYLKANGYGRVTFLPLTSVKPRVQLVEVTKALKESGVLGVANELVKYDSKYERVISNLLGNTLIVDTLDNATFIANKYNFSFKIVTLDGEEFSTRGSISGGSRKKDSVGILSGERKIDDILSQLNEKKALMSSLKDKKTTLEQKRDSALDELNILNDLYRQKQQLLILEREKQSSLENSLSVLEREIDSNAELLDEVEAKLKKISADYESVTSNDNKLEQDKISATQEADKQQAEFEELRKQRDGVSDEISKCNVRITELKGIISSSTNDENRLSGVIADANSAVRNLNSSNKGASEIIENLKLEQEKVTLTKDQQDSINSIRQEIEKIENDKITLKDDLNKLDVNREEISQRVSELLENRHTQEISLTKIDTDLEYMGQSILEDYGETYETAVSKRDSSYDAGVGESEIARIRKKRSSLGVINASAIEDYKALKERYDEMLVQRQDLEKAETDLKIAIDKIKAEMLSQFDERFNQINENFKVIFKELFGGGRAMLQMDYSEADDKLEAGVEIVAEPPGKKLQKLSLLSGGEKALTAIAILFSILKLTPMPFCVLDEIEAALDEANVDRFARYLKKFSQDTQFIVITHRKPTMELADALFGVTMPEKGVSKLVSVKLSDISEINTENLA